MHVEPMATAEMRVEALGRNAVSAIAAAFAPGAVLMVPIAGALTLPDVLLDVMHLGLWAVDFVPSCGTVCLVKIMLRTSADFLMLYVAGFFMLYVLDGSMMFAAVGVIVAISLSAAGPLGHSRS